MSSAWGNAVLTSLAGLLQRPGIQEGLPAPSQQQAGVQKGQRHGSGPCLPSSFSWLRTTLIPWMADSLLWGLLHLHMGSPSVLACNPLYLFSDKDTCHWTCPTPSPPDKPGGSHFEILHLRISAKIFSQNKFNLQTIFWEQGAAQPTIGKY